MPQINLPNVWLVVYIYPFMGAYYFSLSELFFSATGLKNTVQKASFHVSIIPHHTSVAAQQTGQANVMLFCLPTNLPSNILPKAWKISRRESVGKWMHGCVSCFQGMDVRERASRCVCVSSNRKWRCVGLVDSHSGCPHYCSGRAIFSSLGCS